MTRGAAIRRELGRLGYALLAGFTVWVSLLSWSGLGERPSLFVTPLLVIALLVAITGWVVRWRDSWRWLAPLAQLVVVAVYLGHRVTGSWWPWPDHLAAVVRRAVDGADIAQRLPSPVSADHPEYHFLLVVCGLGIVLVFDFLACTLARPAIAGLALLLSITISTSLLLEATNLLVFLTTAAAWLALIALREHRQLAQWEPDAPPAPATSAVGLAIRIGVAGVLVALAVASPLTSQGRDFGNLGQGTSRDTRFGGINPFLDLKRNLTQGADIDLLEVRAPTQPQYVKTTTLEKFTGTAWEPRRSTDANTSELTPALPALLGVLDDFRGPDQVWRMRTTGAYNASYLPIPSPSTEITGVGSGWRVDPDTHDIVSAGRTRSSGLSYDVTTFEPRVSGRRVLDAGSVPTQVRTSMTALPPTTPEVFRDTALRVTRNATNQFDRAILLQRWFTTEGRFEYTTERKEGSGIDTLTSFITVDRRGYCEQFAAAYAVMARSLGLPTRIAIGFLSPERRGDDWVFSSHDLHAWPEVYFSGVGWIRFEPTPPDRTGNAPSYTQQLVGALPDQEASSSAEPSAAPSAQPERRTPAQREAAARQGGSGIWLTAVLVALGGCGMLILLLLPRLIRRRRAARRWAGAGDPAALAAAAWSEVRDTSTDLGLDFSEHRTLRDNEATLSRAAGGREGREALTEVVRFVELTRYARPREYSRDYLAQVRRNVELWQASAYECAGSRDSRRATWLPRSVLTRFTGN